MKTWNWWTKKLVKSLKINKLEIDEKKKTREKSENKQKLVKENPSLEFFFSFQDPWTLNRNCDHHRDFRGEFTVGTRRDFSGSQFDSREWVCRDFWPIFQLWWLGIDGLAVWTPAFCPWPRIFEDSQDFQVLDFWARGLDRSVATNQLMSRISRKFCEFLHFTK